jgi:hypothetical protein
MGLDGVEIVMAVEDAFEIKIEDKEAEKCITPRDVIDLVMGKVQPSDEQVCLSQRSFHLLRRAFIERGISRPKFRLDSRLEEIVPKKNRRIAWQSLSQKIGTPVWPSLERPGWLQIIIWLCAILFAFWTILKIPRWESSLINFFTWIAACCAATWLGYFLTRPFASSFPQSHSTIRELVSFLVIRNPQVLKIDQKKWSREQVAAVIREIVIETLDCKNYREDARFVEDLGLS